MTHTDLCNWLKSVRHADDAQVEKLPEGNPEDFYVFSGEDELAAVVADIEAKEKS